MQLDLITNVIYNCFSVPCSGWPLAAMDHVPSTTLTSEATRKKNVIDRSKYEQLWLMNLSPENFRTVEPCGRKSSVQYTHCFHQYTTNPF